MTRQDARKSYGTSSTSTAAMYANLTRHDALYDAITMLAAFLAGLLVGWALTL